jgi:hypothetical protein
VGSERPVRVSSVLTTANGRLVFGRLIGVEDRPPAPRRPSPASGPPRSG